MTPEIMKEIALIRDTLDRMLAEAQPVPDRYAVLCAVAEQMGEALQNVSDWVNNPTADHPADTMNSVEKALAAFEAWKRGN